MFDETSGGQSDEAGASESQIGSERQESERGPEKEKLDQVIAILVAESDYSRIPEEACEQEGIKPIILPWTEDVNKDLENIEKCRADIVFIQLHHTHHGVRVADSLLGRKGVDVVYATSVMRDGVRGVEREEYRYSEFGAGVVFGREKEIPKIREFLRNGSQFLAEQDYQQQIRSLEEHHRGELEAVKAEKWESKAGHLRRIHAVEERQLSALNALKRKSELYQDLQKIAKARHRVEK